MEADVLKDIDKAYFDRRAREARALAEKAHDEGIARIHRLMATEYEAKAQTLREVSGGHRLRNSA